LACWSGQHAGLCQQGRIRTGSLRGCCGEAGDGQVGEGVDEVHDLVTWV
jgi:hypothetical protein